MPQASSARILLLEHDPEARNTLREVLQSAGFEVLEVGGAIQALEQALAVPPDLALVSLERPYLEGFRVCQEWQRQERLRQIPFVFLAESDAEPSAEARAVFLGATAVWRKPLDAGLVVEQVRDLLQKDQNLARAEVVPAVAESQKLGEISDRHGLRPVAKEVRQGWLLREPVLSRFLEPPAP